MHGRNRDCGKCINTGEEAINIRDNEALCCEIAFYRQRCAAIVDAENITLNMGIMSLFFMLYLFNDVKHVS